MELSSFIILIGVAIVFGYCGGKRHGFHKLLKAIGLD